MEEGRNPGKVFFHHSYSQKLLVRPRLDLAHVRNVLQQLQSPGLRTVLDYFLGSSNWPCIPPLQRETR